MSLTYVKASCHCGLNAFQIPFLTSKLPQETDMCHCTSCRHITGMLSVHCATIEGKPLAADSSPDAHKPADLSNLSTYAASEHITRYFCSKCSAYIFYETKAGGWSVSTGTLEKTEGIVKVGYHIFVADTLDGGVADHYRVIDGKELPRYELEENGKTLPVGWKAERLLSKKVTESADKEKLAAYCHCKTISLYITRSPQEVAKDEAKWWLVPAKEDDPSSRVRYVAGHCFCTSCRTTSGSVFQTNMILPRANIFDAHTDRPIRLAIPKDGSTNSDRPRGLKQYESSPRTYREFCEKCGASVFFWTKAGEGKFFPVTEGEETEVMDINSGLVDEEDGGARAERWAAWHNRVIHGEDALDKPGKDAVQASIEGFA